MCPCTTPATATPLHRARAARYNAPLRPLVSRLDATSNELWSSVPWLPATPDAIAAASGAPGMDEFRRAASELRVSLSVRSTSAEGGLGRAGEGRGGSGVSGGGGVGGGGGGGAEASVIRVGSARWFGSGPRPSVFVLGARESGAEVVSEALTSLAGHCGAPLRFFDDDVRYSAGLPSVTGRFVRQAIKRAAAAAAATSVRLGGVDADGGWEAAAGATGVSSGIGSKRPGGAAAACQILVDTTAYLHSRWAAARIHATLERSSHAAAAATHAPPKFVIVLSDPVDRAVRHWRSITAALARGGGGVGGGSGAGGASGGGGGGGGTGPGGGASGARAMRPLGARGEVSHLASYTNGSTLVRKLRSEASHIQQCLTARGAKNGGRAASGGGGGGEGSSVSVRAWQTCTTLACNWVECVLGVGLYAPQLRHWLSYFPSERFLLLEESELRLNPKATGLRLSRFLAGPVPLHGTGVLATAANRTLRPPTVGESVRRVLHSFYHKHTPEVRKLFEELSMDESQGESWQGARWLTLRK